MTLVPEEKQKAAFSQKLSSLLRQGPQLERKDWHGQRER